MPLEFVIEYHAGRGFEDEALLLARRLFAHFDEAIEALTLVPLPDDAAEDLALYLDGRLVRSRRRSGQSPLVADVRAALAAAPDGPAPPPAE